MMARSILALAVVLGTNACGGDDAAFEDDSWDDERVVREILQPSCGISACHAQPEPAAGLVLATVEGTHASAVGRAPTIGTAAADHVAIITPGNADRSFLITKVTTPAVDEGLPMPPNEWRLSDEAIAVLREWIDQLESGS